MNNQDLSSHQPNLREIHLSNVTSVMILLDNLCEIQVICGPNAATDHMIANLKEQIETYLSAMDEDEVNRVIDRYNEKKKASKAPRSTGLPDKPAEK